MAMQPKRRPTWRFEGTEIIDVNGDDIAKVYWAYTADGQARGRLIAAAPRLLDACRAALRDLREGSDDAQAVEDELVGAIAEATGATIAAAGGGRS